MTPYPNLISESLLINETVALLRSFGGKASAVSVVDFVMKIRKPDPRMARLLVAELIERDPRLSLNIDTVELAEDGFESRELAATEFVVFAISETTGAKAPLAALPRSVRTESKMAKVAEKFETLVNPETPIPPFITHLTGIRDEMVADAPKFADIAHDFLSFIGDSILVAHNSGFDMRFLNSEVARVYPDYRVASRAFAQVLLSRKLLPDIVNHKPAKQSPHITRSTSQITTVPVRMPSPPPIFL